MKAEHEVVVQLAHGPRRLQDLARNSGYSKDSIYKAADDLHRSGLLRKFKEGKEVVASLSRSPEARRLARLYLTAVSHGVDPEAFGRRSFVDTWRCLKRTRQATVRECVEATRLSYESVRKAFHFLLRSGLARTQSEKPLRISLEEHDLNRYLEYCFLESPRQTVLTLAAAPFVKVYAQPFEVEELLMSEEGPVVIRGVERRMRPQETVKIIEVMEEEVTPETVFLREVQRADGVEDLCIQLLSGHPMNFDRLLELSQARGVVNIVGCYLDILSDLAGDLVVKGDAERFLPFASSGQPPVFLESEEEFGKEGWEGPYEERWNVDLYLDMGAIEHGVRGAR